LWRQLHADGFTNIDFVGSLMFQNCGEEYDGDNDGHGAYLVTGIMNGNYPRPEEGTVDSWVQNANPDIVLMHFGTNDVMSNIASSQILQAFDFILNKIRGKNPQAILLVAQIIPVAASSCGQCSQSIPALNAAIATWAEQRNTAASPVIAVDHYIGFNANVDTKDGIHPSDSGDQKMMNAWLKPVEAALQSFSC
jgi:lysophospholipase L1-like esterase